MLLLGDADIIAAMVITMRDRSTVRFALRCITVCVLSCVSVPAVLPGCAHAQLRPSPPVMPTHSPAPAASLVADDKRYAASFAGIRSYMDELARSNPERHRVLSPAYDSLLKRRRRLAGVGASLVLAGLCSVALALAFDDDLPRTTRIGTMYGGATAMFVGGAMLGVLGSRHEAQRFVEVHQRLVPAARLRLELAGTARSASIVASARF